MLTVSSVVLCLLLIHLFQCLEAIVHQFDGLVNILLRYVVSEMELGHALRDSDDGEQRSRGDVHVADLLLALSLELSLFDIACDDVLMQLVRDHWLEGLCLCDKRSHDLGINPVGIHDRRVQFLMHRCDMLCQLLVHFRVCFVQEKEDQVESGEQGGREVDVLVR